MSHRYNFLPLPVVLSYVPEMEDLKVSEVARGPNGFLSVYRRFSGDANRLPDKWKAKRNAFIARHLAQYKRNPTHRRKLALIAWAYMPRG